MKPHHFMSAMTAYCACRLRTDVGIPMTEIAGLLHWFGAHSRMVNIVTLVDFDDPN